MYKIKYTMRADMFVENIMIYIEKSAVALTELWRDKGGLNENNTDLHKRFERVY